MEFNSSNLKFNKPNVLTVMNILESIFSFINIRNVYEIYAQSVPDKGILCPRAVYIFLPFLLKNNKRLLDVLGGNLTNDV